MTLASIDDILATPELETRPAHQPDHHAENRALVELAGVIARQPELSLQKLVNAARELTGAESAGISIVEMDGDKKVLRCRATSGQIQSAVGVGVSLEMSPSQIAIDCNTAQLLIAPAGSIRILLSSSPT